MKNLNGIEYLVGNKNISKRSVLPYDKNICDFLSDLSDELNSTSESKKYPDIKPMKDEIWKKSTRTVSENEVYQALRTGKYLWGVVDMTTNLSHWQEVCNDYKTIYKNALRMYGGGSTTEKDF